jgi:hypothetical protein
VQRKQPNSKIKAVKVTKPDSREINYFIWQDIKSVQFMSTVYIDENFNNYKEKGRERRKKITNYNPDLAKAPLQISNPIDEYNKRMRYVD